MIKEADREAPSAINVLMRLYWALSDGPEKIFSKIMLLKNPKLLAVAFKAAVPGNWDVNSFFEMSCLSLFVLSFSAACRLGIAAKDS